ncbi:MAG TPA: hypothetical protein VM689_10990 [Aliidongia sp.]|nr:hypothetical protein [Aliidongia sp.]
MSGQANNDQRPGRVSEDSSIIEHLVKTFPKSGPSPERRHVVSSEGFGRIRRQWNSDSRMMLLETV